MTQYDIRLHIVPTSRGPLPAGEVLELCDVVFLAVKPHLLERSLEQIAGRMSAQQKDNIRSGKKLFVSVIAGLKLDRVTEVGDGQRQRGDCFIAMMS